MLLEARIAKPKDYRQISTLCRRAVGSHDYALHFLSETIKEGGLFLAFEGGRLVGMTNFEKCIDGSGWLSMARTHPDWRGRGVAVFLQVKITDYARSRGVKALRLWTLATNKPAVRACQKSGFKRVCEALHVSASLRKAKRPSRVSNVHSVSRGFLRSVLQSSYIAKMNGYAAYRWHFLKATRQLLVTAARERELHEEPRAKFVLTVAEKWGRRMYSNFTLLDGKPASAFRAVKEAGQVIGANIIGGYIPNDRYIVRVAKRAGFRSDRWARRCIVFEKAAR